MCTERFFDRVVAALLFAFLPAAFFLGAGKDAFAVTSFVVSVLVYSIALDMKDQLDRIERALLKPE